MRHLDYLAPLLAPLCLFAAHVSTMRRWQALQPVGLGLNHVKEVAKAALVSILDFDVVKVCVHGRERRVCQIHSFGS